MITFFEKIMTVRDPSDFTLFENSIIMLVGSALVLVIVPMLIFDFVVNPTRFVDGIINYIDRIKKEFNQDE